jgi:uncharacterized protein (DUF58 family)
VSLTYRDPLGLFTRSRRFPDIFEIEVVPAAVPLRAFRFLPGGLGFREQARTVPRPGASAEFYAIRPYAYGDSPRWIHWLSTARVGRLMTRQYQTVVDRRALIVLDCSGGPYFRRGAESFETAVSAAASIARFAVENDYEVGLLTIARDGRVFEPAAGGDHLRHILSFLALVEQEGGRAPLLLTHPAVAGVRSVVFVSPEPGREVLQGLVRARDEGRSVLAALCAGKPGGRRARRVTDAAAWLAERGIFAATCLGRERLRHDLENPLGLAGAPRLDLAVDTRAFSAPSLIPPVAAREFSRWQA